MTHRIILVAGLLAGASLAACDDDPRVATDATVDGGRDGGAPEACALEPLPLQPVARFPVGHTHYLPRVPQCRPADQSDRWQLVGAPDGNLNQVEDLGGAEQRFTPHLPGEYGFVLEGTGEIYSFTAVADRPFEQLHYYPTRSIAAVGDELWVAAVHQPEIVRVDPAAGAVIGGVPVGPWPTSIAWQPDAPFAVVTHKAGDTLGLIDVDAGRIVDSVWVGDEPSEVVLSPDGALAYVSLPIAGQVAVVDLAARAVTARIDAAPDVIPLALSPDGATLYAAAFRSSVSDRYPYGEDPRADAFDIAVIDTASGEVSDYIEGAGATIYGLLATDDRLYVATTRVEPAEFALEPGMTAFAHVVAAYDRGTLAEVAVADLTRQASSGGTALRAHNMALLDGQLWVAIEGSDLTLALDAETLEEVSRVETAGRPRSLVAHDGRVAVHGWQAQRVMLVDPADGSQAAPITYDGDPRTMDEALGQQLFSGAGAGFGENHGCSDCHVDGLNDGTVWRAGPTEYFAASRPFAWLEGAEPTGWEADAYDLETYIYGSPATTVGLDVTPERLRAFYAFLASLAPPPGPTDTTDLDGSLSEAGARGRIVFAGKALCVTCHALPLTTNRQRLAEGTEAHPTEVPILVGAYRYNSWLLSGGARSLDEAVGAMLPLSGDPELTADERADLVRFLGELSNRDLFVLDASPRTGTPGIRPGAPITLTFSKPLLDTAENLGRITMQLDGQAVDAAVELTGPRTVRITPDADDAWGSAARLAVAAELESFDERPLDQPFTADYIYVAQPTLRFGGDYAFVIDKPALNLELGGYDPDNTRPISNPWTLDPTPWGARATADLGDGVTQDFDLVLDGDQLRVPAVAYREAGRGPSRTFPTVGTVIDDDDDGIIERVEGTLLFRAPGAEARDVTWALGRPMDEPDPPEPACDGQSQGTHALTVERGERGPVVEWPAEAAALGMYVIAPEAMAPLGPGPVTGGEAWWVVQTANFPEGFGPRVVYGEVPEGAEDATEASGGMAGGSELPVGACIKVHVTFTDFSMSVYRMVW